MHSQRMPRHRRQIPLQSHLNPELRTIKQFLMLVCQTMMLNLFIGMILDNFSFITDEVPTPFST